MRHGGIQAANFQRLKNPRDKRDAKGWGLVQQSEIAEELAARRAELRPFILEALQDRTVALSEKFLAQTLRVRRAGVVAARAVLVSLREP